MERLEKIYEGKAKTVYSTSDPDLLIMYFKDEATAFDGTKRGQILNKGIINNKISSKIFMELERRGIATHFVKTLSDREMLVKRMQMIPVEVVMRNVAAGSLAKRMGIEEGTPLRERVIELFYKSDPLHDPMINEYHIRAFNLATDSELKIMVETADKINDILLPMFAKVGIRLVDYKLEFGEHHGRILLGDEITPDGCRLWDMGTDEKLDKDRFRRDLGKLEWAYEEVFKRVMSI